MKTNYKLLIYTLTILITMVACDTFKDNELHDYSETVKSIDGVWQLQTVERNGIDITNAMDFTNFRLNLNADGTYTIDNYLPFAVKEPGTWALDDPQYPFSVSFRQNNAGSDVVVNLKYPIVEGKRIIAITLSPGCYSNTYNYVFEKVETN